jgi:parallel beta-helix repeat protein
MEITIGGNPTPRGNQINRNGQQALRIRDGSRGVAENNDLTDNKQVPGCEVSSRHPA